MRRRNPDPVRHPTGFIAPCLPTNDHTVPTGPAWVYEITPPMTLGNMREAL